MKTEIANKLFLPLLKKLEKDGDAYSFVHFSKEDDCFSGTDSKLLDMGDALIIIKHLINKFEINKNCL